MIKVLRCLCVGLLLCGVLPMAASKKVIKKDQCGFKLSTYFTAAAAIWTLQENGGKMVTLVKTCAPKILNGLKACGTKTLEVGSRVGFGIKVGCWDYTLKPAKDLAYNNSTTAMTVPFAGFCAKGLWNEFKQKKDNTDSAKTVLYLLGTFTSLGIVLAEWHAWPKIVGVKDAVLDKLGIN